MGLVPFCTALLVRNERERFLGEVLDHHGQWGPVVVLDDHSTDGTYEFCQAHPAVEVCQRLSADGPMWGNESPARQHLWGMAADFAQWCLFADADQLLSADPRPLCLTAEHNAISFILYDLWDTRSTYRADGFWRGHEFPRPWLFRPDRVPAGYVARWNPRGIHTGHCPANFPLSALVAPPDTFYWRHLGYLDPKDRQAKLTRYRSQYHQMSDFEKLHAESIADPSPSLRILPADKPYRVLVGGPVRKRADVLRAHLDSLAWQEVPKGVEVSYLFVDDYPAPDIAQQVLVDFVGVHGGRVLKNQGSPDGDFSDNHPVTHQWSVSAMNRVGAIKNGILAEAVNGGFDAVWLVDSDLILDPTTFTSLLEVDRPVVSAVYWTRWNTDPTIHAGPQVWLKPPYQLSLPHYPEHEFRTKLGVKRAIERVAGLGACTLIKRAVIEKGVHFGKPPGFASGGLWDGEDRHFCEWARRLHVDLWADGWPDIFHVYHQQDIEQRMAFMQSKLAQPHPTFPNTGHLVSLKLTNLDQGVGPVPIRCTLGDGTLLPEVEMHVMSMRRGEEKIARIHFPSTTEIQGLGGTSKLIQIEVVDCKAQGMPPVLEDEFYALSGQPFQDMTHLTDAQHKSIMETANG